MRQLTVKRDRKFTASLMNVKIYVTDAVVCDSLINGQSCRLLGTLGNGEEKTFEITEDACGIYATADELSKNYCVDMYRLPASGEPVSLSGHNVLSPFMGNPFRFDGNDGEEAKAFRKESKEKRPKSIIIIPIVAAVTVIALAAGGAVVRGLLSRERPQTFTYGEMSMTLTDKFKVDNNATEFKHLYSPYESISILTADSGENNLPADTTADKYAELLIKAGGFKDAELSHTDGGVPCFTIESKQTVNGKEKSLRSSVYIFKNGNKFYVIEISRQSGQTKNREQKQLEWIESVAFNK